MNNTFCEAGNHQYGQWKIKNDNIGFRTCDKCSYTEELPLTEEIKNENEKRKLSTAVLEEFKTKTVEDKNFINYINAMLEYCINYLDKEQINTLNIKINEYKNSSQIDITNATLLTALQKTYKEKKIEEFYTTLEEFQKYNQTLLNQSLQREGYSK